MSDTARDYQPKETASTEGLEEIFEVECQGESAGLPDISEGVTESNRELLTLAEAARRLGIPYTTFYKQVKAGKHDTVTGADGKPRIIFGKVNSVTPGVTGEFTFPETVTLGITRDNSGVTEAKYLDLLSQLHAKLEGANYRIGWLESQLKERETDVQELKLLVDSQHKPAWWRRFGAWFFGR